MVTNRELAEAVRRVVLDAEKKWPYVGDDGERARFINLINQILRDLQDEGVVLMTDDDKELLDDLVAAQEDRR